MREALARAVYWLKGLRSEDRHLPPRVACRDCEKPDAETHLIPCDACNAWFCRVGCFTFHAPEVTHEPV